MMAKPKLDRLTPAAKQRLREAAKVSEAKRLELRADEAKKRAELRAGLAKAAEAIGRSYTGDFAEIDLVEVKKYRVYCRALEALTDG